MDNIIKERDDMIYGRKPRNEKRIKEINELLKEEAERVARNQP